MEYQEILNFWFGRSNDINYGKPRKIWFIKNEEFDGQIKSKFENIYNIASSGKLDSWQQQALSCLALIIILDQFPRNIFRGKPEAFATDNLANKFSKIAIANRLDLELLPVQRWFIYLPLEHSENLSDQEMSVKLFNNLQNNPNSQSTIDYAYRHLKIIKRFGRFPHRNKILGRKSTPEEIEFLTQPGSSF